MSLINDYQTAQSLAKDHSFRVLIMAAIEAAELGDRCGLAEAFPDIWKEYFERYHRTDNLLKEERVMTDEAQHTPGLMKVRGSGIGVIDHRDGVLIMVARAFSGTGSSQEVQEANARYIAACWNACKDISTEALKAGVVGRLLHAARTVLAEHCPDPEEDCWKALADVLDEFAETQP